MSKIRVTSYCECPFSDAIDFAQRSLADRSEVQVSPSAAMAEAVTHATKVVDDASDGARIHDALLLVWKPDHRMFPDFRGVLTVRPRDRGVSMRLEGHYEPPFGVAGQIFDAVAGNHIAELTARRLLQQITGDVEHLWATARRNGA